MTTSAQITVLAIYSVLIGIVIGMIYDIFRMIRIAVPDKIKGKPAESLIVFFEDILFWMISAVIFIVFIYYVNKGHTRLVMITDALIGFILYHFTLGRLVMFCSGFIIGIVKSFLNLLDKIFVKPLIFAFTRVIITLRKNYYLFSNKRAFKKAERIGEKGFGL